MSLCDKILKIDFKESRNSEQFNFLSQNLSKKRNFLLNEIDKIQHLLF